MYNISNCFHYVRVVFLEAYVTSYSTEYHYHNNNRIFYE